MRIDIKLKMVKNKSEKNTLEMIFDYLKLGAILHVFDPC